MKNISNFQGLRNKNNFPALKIPFSGLYSLQPDKGRGIFMDTEDLKHKALMCALPAMMLLNSCGTVESGSYQDPKVNSQVVYSEVMKKSMEYEGPARNPVIVIHGLLGSKLVDGEGVNIWGSFSLGEMLSGNKLSRLAHPMEHGVPLAGLHSDVHPHGLLDRSQIRVLGLSFDYEGYNTLVDTLAASGFVPDDRPLPNNKKFYSQFIFYYDWRRDISENAARLKEFILEKKHYLQAVYDELYGLRNYDVHFDLIGHSMGGLVARYFMRYGGTRLADDGSLPPLNWEGAKFVDRVVIIATPNAGYPDTFLELVEGLRLTAAAPVYPKAVIGTFTSYYEMLPDPENRCIVYAGSGDPVDYLNPELWLRYKWGLADPAEDEWLKVLLPGVATKEERYRVALDHLKKNLAKARQFKAAMRVPATRPKGVSAYLFVGDSHLTNSELEVNPETGRVTVAKRSAGDGKIPAMSVRLDSRSAENWLPYPVSPVDWTAVYHFPGGHMGIMNSAVFKSNLSYILLSSPTAHQKADRKVFEELIRKGENGRNR